MIPRDMSGSTPDGIKGLLSFLFWCADRASDVLSAGAICKSGVADSCRVGAAGACVSDQFGLDINLQARC